jgi:hypothetical protein
MVRIHLRRSKCDQFGGGVDVVIGRTGTSLCPVTAVMNYLYIRQDCPRAFFCLQDGTPVSKPWFIAKIRGILSSRLRWPQLQDWSCNDGSIGGCGGLYDSGLGTMAECSVPAVYPHPAEPTCSHLAQNGDGRSSSAHSYELSQSFIHLMLINLYPTYPVRLLRFWGVPTTIITLGDFCRTPHIMRQGRGLAIAPPQNHDRCVRAGGANHVIAWPLSLRASRQELCTEGGTRYRAASDHVN